MSEPLFTCIVTCKVCGAELNRATGVPDDDRTQIIISAPLMAICKVRDHNTFSDCNIGAKLDWFEETPAGLVPEKEATP